MIITARAPFRISFFGGGTDYDAWYNEHGGEVISTTIDKYCYISIRKIDAFFDYKYRLSWRKIEECSGIKDIDHKTIKEIFRMYEISNISLHHDADIPGRSGIGSSSAFTVCLLKAISEMQKLNYSKHEIAQKAISIEKFVLKENIGLQDQIATSYGGFNKITINKDASFNVDKIKLSKIASNELNNHMMLIFTGKQRISHDIAGIQISEIKNKQKELHEISSITKDAYKMLTTNIISVEDFARLLDASWQIKKCLTDKISNDTIDEIYKTAIANGAMGGKLLGAGSAGFMLFCAKTEYQEQIAKALGLLHVHFKFEDSGVQVCHTVFN